MEDIGIIGDSKYEINRMKKISCKSCLSASGGSILSKRADLLRKMDNERKGTFCQ